MAGKSTCTVITMARWDWFSKWADERIMKRGTEYEAMKNQFGQRMWEQTLTLYPQLRDKVKQTSFPIHICIRTITSKLLYNKHENLHPANLAWII